MGTIVCQGCNRTLGHFEDEKVTTLYSTNENCDCANNEIESK
jgi:hypothetical protein